MGGEVSVKIKLVFFDGGKYTEEVRCSACQALLLKRQLRKSREEQLGVEVKCRRCGTMNHI
jgi:phage FluMu protein Com